MPTCRRPILNKLYIFVGTLIIAVLVGGLIGPFFIDWTAYREVFEEEASKALGHPVRVAGDADARFLPAPAFTFTDVRVGESEGKALAQIDKISIRMELMPLLRGEFQVTELTAEKPVVSAAIDDAGRLDWFLTTDNRTPIDPDKVFFDQVRVNNGTLRLIDGRRDNIWALDDVNFEGNARSLFGPFRAEGEFTYEEQPTSFRIATGRTDDLGNLRVTMLVSPQNAPVSLSTDGKLSNSEGGPVYEGEYTFKAYAELQDGQKTEEPPIRSQGLFSLTSADLEMPEFLIALGPASVASTLQGQTRILFGDTPRFDVRLRTDQIDLDRSIGNGPAQPARPSQVSALLAQLALATPTELGVEGRMRLDVGSIVLGGSIVERLSFDASNDRDGWRVDNFGARFPGRTALVASGRVAKDPAGPTPEFKGRISLASLQPGRFAVWARPNQPVPGSPPPAVKLEARTVFGVEHLLLEEITGSLGDDSLTGKIDLKTPLGARSQLEMTIDADRLDMDAINDLTRLLSGRDAMAAAAVTDNVSVNLTATRLVSEGVNARDVIIDASLADGLLDMRRIQMDDVAGANIAASGRLENIFTKPTGDLSADLDAQDLTGVVTLLAPYIDGLPIYEAVTLAAPALAPANLKTRFVSEEAPEGIKADLQVTGTAGGSPLSLSSQYVGSTDALDNGEVTFTLAADAEDSSRLLRQFSIPTEPAVTAHPGALSLSGQGSLEAGIFSSLVADLAGTRMNAEGFIRPGRGTALGFDGSMTLTTQAINPLLAMAGISFSGALQDELGLSEGFAVDLAGQVSLDGGRMDAEIASASIDGEEFRGSGTLDLTGDVPSVVGDFVLDRMSLPWALSLGMGEDPFAFVIDETIWSDNPFQVTAFGDLELAIGLRATVLEISDNLVADNAGVTIIASAGNLGVELTDAGFAGGLLSGIVNIRNTLGSVVMNGNLSLSEAALEEVVWRPEGRAAALGALNVTADFEGSGDTMIDLVSSLTGGGTLLVENGEFRSLNPIAFRRAMRATDAGLELEEEKINEVFMAHVDDGELPFTSVQGAFSIVSGAIRARSISVEAENATALGGGNIDLINFVLDSEWNLRVDAGENAVVGADQQIGLLFEGPLENPEREIDVSALTGFLTLRAFETEVQRIENQEADFLEKERFGRELRMLRERRERRERKESFNNNEADVAPTPDPAANDNVPVEENLEDRVRNILQNAN
ncbi:MAG: AsmA family protein [Hyphomicrobiales bacterium]